MVSRRDFARTALAALPLCAVRRAAAAPGLRLGVTTFSYRGLLRTPGRDNVDDIIQAVRVAGLREIELHSANTEPAGPNSGPAVPPPPSAYPPPITAPSKEEVAAAQLAVRNSLRSWRLQTPPAKHEAFRAKFAAAGIAVASYRVDYDQSFTDPEIDVTFQQAKALGVNTISSPVTLGMARRLTPFAAKHGIILALRNTSNPKDADAIAGPPSIGTALGLSKDFRLSLDLGNFTAANFEAVAFLQENHAALSQIVIKDRTRNGGSNEQLGDGDTPIKDVLAFLRDKQIQVPVLVEYEYIGLGTPQEEVRKCLAFVKSVTS
jgi:sugar phosphate isomerase/epimerase